MIDKSIRKQILEEIEKSGNVYFACTKVGLSRATFYRWKKCDDKFSKSVDRAFHSGRMAMCDVAEHMLMKKVKEGEMKAIVYVLAHNSKIYRPRNSTKVILEHRSDKNNNPPAYERTLEDLLREEDERRNKQAKLDDVKDIGSPTISPLTQHDIPI